MRHVILVTLILLATYLAGCGGDSENIDTRHIDVRINQVPETAEFPMIALVKVNATSYETEWAADIGYYGYNVDVTIRTIPDDPEHLYLVVFYNDRNGNNRYDYRTDVRYSEELGIWEGYLIYDPDRRAWAGYDRDDDSFMFSDVTRTKLYIKTVYTYSTSDATANAIHQQMTDFFATADAKTKTQ